MSESRRHSAPEGKLRLPRFGGAAVPAVLVGVSVLLVLLVVLIQSVMGGGGASVVPLGGGSPPVVDQGQVADGQTQSGPDQRSASASVKPSKSGTPKPSGSASAAPTPPTTTPTVGVTSPGAPPPPPPPPTFSAIAVEAESATLAGSAHTDTTRCPTCSRGTEVRFIGGTNNDTVTFSGLKIPAAATYHLTIAYVLGDAPRSFFISVNGGAATEVACTDFSAGWQAPKNKTVAIVLPAGTDTVRFGNSSGAAPDLDKITLGP